MATATEIATKALRRLRVIGAGETPSADQVANAIDALGVMISSWTARGLTNDTLPLLATQEHGVTALLAVQLAEDYGKQAGPALLADANHGWHNLCGAYFTVPSSKDKTYSQEAGTILTPSYVAYTGGGYGGVYGNYSGTSAWSAGTTYALGQIVTNSGNIYVNVQLGVSGGSPGPTGTTRGIIDNQCLWDYSGVFSG